MRYCGTCNANIAEPFERCPLCQNELTGEDDIFIFPVTSGIRKKSVGFKIVSYLSFVAFVISFCLDYIVGLHGGLHWSIIVAIWCAYVHITIAPIFIKLRPIGEVVWNLNFWGAIGSILTTWVVDRFDILFGIIIPILLIVVLGLEFIITLVEKYAGSMQYFLIAALVSLVLVVVRLICGYETVVLLNIALSTAVVLTILLLALGSEKVYGDIKKKLSI